MRHEKLYNWKRFWVPRDGVLYLTDDGFLVDPESEESIWTPHNLIDLESVKDEKCVVLLGEPGIGKTSVLRAYNAELTADVEIGKSDLVYEDLGSFGDEKRLVEALFERQRKSRDLRSKLWLLLDGLDECLPLMPKAARIIGSELEKTKPQVPHLRLACRTALWPESLETALAKVYDVDSINVLELAPLRRRDVVTAAQEEGVDADRFLEEIIESAAVPLASRPMTLSFLIKEFRANKRLSKSRCELYEAGCRALCREGNPDRLQERMAGDLDPSQRLAVAARLAVLTAFCNKKGIDISYQRGAPDSDFLQISQAAGGYEEADSGSFEVTADAIRETLDTGLFTGRGPELMGWGHKTYEEFLAAHHLTTKSLNASQILGLMKHPHDPDHKVVPQLGETAAWIASMVPAVQNGLLETDPEVLLQSDALGNDCQLKADVTAQLLSHVDDERIVFDIYDKRLARLCHSAISLQIKPYLVEKGRSDRAKRLAINIAKACPTNELQSVLVSVAYDTEAAFDARISAAYAVATTGTDDHKKSLKALLEGDFSDDINDELRGAVLQALWPSHLTAGELIPHLSYPRNDHFFGIYFYFLHSLLAAGVKDCDLPTFLDWVADRSEYSRDRDRFEEATAQIMCKAWDNLELEGVLPSFACAALSRISRYEPILGWHTDHPDGPQLTDHPSRRRKVVKAIIRLISDPKRGSQLLTHGGYDLVTEDDIPWLIEGLVDERDLEAKEIYSRMIRYTFTYGRSGLSDEILRACEDESVLREVMAPFIEPMLLDSPAAKNAQQQYTDNEERLKRRPNQNILDPPPLKRVQALLSQIRKSEYSNWWLLVRELCLKPESTHYENTHAGDVTKTPVWPELTDEERTDLVDAAFKYLEECNPGTGEWLLQYQYDYRAAAGYKALRLLQKLRKTVLTRDLPRDLWRKWTASVLAYFFDRGDDDEEAHCELVAICFDMAPDEVLDTLRVLISKDNEAGNHVSKTWQVDCIFDGRVAELLRSQAFHSDLKPSIRSDLVKQLLGHDDQDTINGVLTFLQGTDSSNESDSDCMVFFASEILVKNPSEAWETVWTLIRDSEWLGRRIIERVAYDFRESVKKFIEQLSDYQLADLYVWLVRRYPFEDDPHPDGVHRVTARMEVNDLRNGILDHLSRRGTFEAVRKVEEIVRQFPQYPFLNSHVAGSRDYLRHKSWQPLGPSAILKLTESGENRLIQDSEDLLDLCVESLGRLQDRMHARTGEVEFLWDNVGRTGVAPRPKREVAFARFVALHLERDLKRVIVNREVQIHNEERTDVQVEAFVAERDGTYGDKLIVVIEVKGCWHDELATAMREQLLDRYLNSNDLNYGIYLVGWFYCDSWKPLRGPLRKINIDEAKEIFDQQAANLSTGGKHVKAVVLDTSLR